MERKLDVLIATHGAEGLQRIVEMDLPHIEGVNYVVTWQAGAAKDDASGPMTAIPLQLNRDDIEIHPSDSIGLSRNRNLGIGFAKAPVCLIADNDLKYRPEQLRSVIDTFNANPDLGLGLFKHDGARKKYPSTEVDLNAGIPRNFYIVSFEIAFRKSSIGQIRFNERFGLGTPFGLAEDDIFFYDCIKAGIKARFFPISITSHPHESTGYRPITQTSVMQGEGAFFRHIHGFAKGLPRVPLFVWRNWRSGRIRFWWGLHNMLLGFLSYRK